MLEHERLDLLDDVHAALPAHDERVGAVLAAHALAAEAAAPELVLGAHRDLGGRLERHARLERLGRLLEAEAAKWKDGW